MSFVTLFCWELNSGKKIYILILVLVPFQNFETWFISTLNKSTYEYAVMDVEAIQENYLIFQSPNENENDEENLDSQNNGNWQAYLQKNVLDRYYFGNKTYGQE